MNDIGEGLLKSTNGGAAWFAINNGISNRFAGFLEMHPQNSRILMAAAGNNAWSYPPTTSMAPCIAPPMAATTGPPF